MFALPSAARRRGGRRHRLNNILPRVHDSHQTDGMTLILTLASRACVLQVSDRMLSRNQRPLYPASNKTVVSLARDGMLTMSYTGPARLGEVAADDWIARQIAGVADWGPPPVAWLMQRRLPQWLDVGRTVHRLAEGLTRAFRDEVPAVWRSAAFELAVGGWQWKVSGSHARPIMWTIARDLVGVFRPRSHFPRHHYGSGFFFSIMPRNSTLTTSEIACVVDQLRNGLAMDASRARGLFVETIRLAASRHPRVVGSHCMSVSLYPPRGDVMFIPDKRLMERRPFPPPLDDPQLQTTTFVHPAPSTDRREEAPAESSYTPWLIVGDHLVVSPTLVQGTTAPFIYSRGEVEFSVGSAAFGD
jgi:hypothetical protein